MKYEEPRRMSRSELDRELDSGDGERILSALISSFYSEDPKWVQSACMRFVHHESASARRGAAIVLGNISHLNPNEVDLVSALDALTWLRRDSDGTVRVAAEDSIEIVSAALTSFKKTQ